LKVEGKKHVLRRGTLSSVWGRVGDKAKDKVEDKVGDKVGDKVENRWRYFGLLALPLFES
jgi:hypothetical protein